MKSLALKCDNIEFIISLTELILTIVKNAKSCSVVVFYFNLSY